jgi:flagellar hook assembly protein FlgD
VGVGDDPISGSSFVNFMRLRSSNPMHSGQARLAFGLAKPERVEVRVFDVTGRAVKTVANRIFAAGQEHVVIWDGTDEAGNKVRSGVYFYQLKTPTWTSQKKLAVLSN